MAKVKIAVVEDEIIIADNICSALENLGYDVLEPAISYTEALETIDNQKPDIVILDIQLSGKKDGIDLAWKIKEDYDIPFIFLTSNADKLTVERVKKLAPPAYLVKPFNKDDLYTSIEIALFNHTKKDRNASDNIIIKDALFIKQNNFFTKVKFDDILFIKSDHIYIEIITCDDQKILIRGSLNEYIKKLNNNFIRVHRGYIVNLHHLQSISHNQLLINEYEIQIGKIYHAELLRKINIG